MSTPIIEELRALAAHYPAKLMEPEARARYWRDYADDLGAVDFDALKDACAAWRRSDASKMARPGELLKLCRKRVTHGKIVLEKARSEAEDWETLKLLDCDTLSLRQKALFHRLAAEDADNLAIRRKWKLRATFGDDCANMANLRADPEWRELDQRRENHAAESERIAARIEAFAPN